MPEAGYCCRQLRGYGGRKRSDLRGVAVCGSLGSGTEAWVLVSK